MGQQLPQELVGFKILAIVANPTLNVGDTSLITMDKLLTPDPKLDTDIPRAVSVITPGLSFRFGEFNSVFGSG